jgi:two-component system chemotaxis response regulator CheY
MRHPRPAFAPTTAAVWPLHILYADARPALRALLCDRLALDGHRVEAVVDAAHALDRLAQPGADFDLIIVDHHMPRIDGLDLVWHIRRLSYAGKIAVLCSELSPAVHERYRRFGVDLLLTMPIFPPTFCQMLRQLFAPADAGPARGPRHPVKALVEDTSYAALARAIPD